MRSRNRLAQKPLCRVGLNRLREKTALPCLTTELNEVIELFDGFHALRDHLEFQLVGQQDNQLHGVTGSAIEQHFPEQDMVDLQSIKRKLPQAAQRRTT